MTNPHDSTSAWTCRVNFSIFRLLLAWKILLICMVDSSLALYAEDAGVLDFLISTTGHGPYGMKVLTALGGSVIVSYAPLSCYVAGRRSFTGELLWRRNVCSGTGNNSKEIFVDAAITESYVLTLEVVAGSAHFVRGWDVATGALLWDVMIHESMKNAGIWTFSSSGVNYAAIGGSGKAVVILDVVTGAIVNDAPSKQAEASKQSSESTTFVSCLDRTIGIDDVNKVAVKRNGDKNPISIFTLNGRLEHIILLSCNESTAAVLLISIRGTTSQLTVSGENDEIESVWEQEEGLAQITAALMLDSSHEDIVNDGRQGVESSVLKLQSRLDLQLRALKNMFTFHEVRRDHIFGFVKIAVLVSESSHRVYGIETVGIQRSNIRYQIDLPERALWHRMIHGSVNSKSGAHGINGRAHTREVLVLSYRNDDNMVDWVCFDGTTGKELAVGSLSISSPIIQILPLPGSGACRQNALFMLDDHSLVFVVDGSVVPESFYAHIVDKSMSSLKTFEISNSQTQSKSSPETNLVGISSFPGESLVSVTYPNRDEVIASPCDVLGDDSLLLKYLNPHLAVITTVATTGNSSEETFQLNTKKKTQKRKPAGVSQSNQDSTSKAVETPNLFFNVVDTVSGRVIYRVSHSNASLHPRPSVLVSENWIFYSFTNSKTLKSELGVLTMYEGMIDKKSLSAFNSPEQVSSFSSLDAREATPVVLLKTFTVPVGVTALGITSTRSGISVRRLLLAGVDGQIHGIDRKLIDPRRPLGQLKDAEKKEGLLQYNEVIQTTPYQTLSYNKTIDSVPGIITAPTDLESQSLILAFGGPDLFFARSSPSRGFDLLPDTFNKPLLSAVVVALVGVLVVVRRIIGTKIRTQGWV